MPKFEAEQRSKPPFVRLTSERFFSFAESFIFEQMCLVEKCIPDMSKNERSSCKLRGVRKKNRKNTDI